ncbi:CLC-1 protein [Aphelenchoides avenae]|nr:CLC-1 protein [Aphelenchus avenae]
MSGWKKGVLACMVLALVVVVVAFACDCFTFSARSRRGCLLIMLPVLASVYALLLCIAVIIYGAKHKDTHFQDDGGGAYTTTTDMKIVFGYSFYIAIVGIILSVINIVIGAIGVRCADRCKPV